MERQTRSSKMHQLTSLTLPYKSQNIKEQKLRKVGICDLFLGQMQVLILLDTPTNKVW